MDIGTRLVQNTVRVMISHALDAASYAERAMAEASAIGIECGGNDETCECAVHFLARRALGHAERAMRCERALRHAREAN